MTKFVSPLIFAILLTGCRAAGNHPVFDRQVNQPVKSQSLTGSGQVENSYQDLKVSSYASITVDKSKKIGTQNDTHKTDGDTETVKDGQNIDLVGSSVDSSRIAKVSFQEDVPTLTPDTVLESVKRCYPEIEIAWNQLEAADGKVTAAEGAFDQKISAHTISQPLGFYQTYRNGVGLEQPLFQGGSVYGTYRIGDGNFEPWFGERETNEGGEFKAGFSIPLVKNREIDQRRTGLFVSQSKREQLSLNIDARFIQFERMAIQSYWSWVAAGRVVQIQQRLLNLAQQRVDQIERRVEEGDLSKIAQIDNQRFIAKRKNTLIKAKRSLQKAAIKLSIYYRDEQCQPVIPEDASLPVFDTPAVTIMQNRVSGDIAIALSSRPEVMELDAKRKQANIELRYAQNLTMPKVDFKGFAGQDLGARASSTGDKSPFELNLALLAEMPVQRREGYGKIQSARAKIQEIDSKQKLVQDKIRAEVQDAASAVNTAYQQIQQSKKNLELTKESLRLGKLSFTQGDIDLISLNIYETSVADAELQLLDARFQYHYYYSVYKTAVSGSVLSR